MKSIKQKFNPKNKQRIGECDICQKRKNCVLWDNWKSSGPNDKGFFNLCFNCAIRMNQIDEDSSMWEETRVCNKCNERFLPKFEFSKSCILCWIKEKERKENDSSKW